MFNDPSSPEGDLVTALMLDSLSGAFSLKTNELITAVIEEWTAPAPEVAFSR